MHPNKKIHKAGFCINRTAPMLGFSPDGIVDKNTLLEIKCPDAGHYYKGDELCDRLQFLKKENGKYMLKRSHTYYTQIQLGLCILNLETAHFVLYSAIQDRKTKIEEESITVLEVHRDESFMDAFIPLLINRYFEFLLPFLKSNENKLLLSKM